MIQSAHDSNHEDIKAAETNLEKRFSSEANNQRQEEGPVIQLEVLGRRVGAFVNAKDGLQEVIPSQTGTQNFRHWQKNLTQKLSKVF